MNVFYGIGLKIASVLLFIVMLALVKATTEHVPTGQIVFFRSFFAVLVIVIWLGATKQLGAGLRTKNPFGHLWRGVIGTASMTLNFWSAGLLPLPEVTAIGYAAPLLTVVFASLFLGEVVRGFRISCVLLGLAGVLIVLSPRLSAFSGGMLSERETAGAFIALGSATCAALVQVLLRRLVVTESTSAIVFYFSLFSTVLSLLTIPGWVVPTRTEFWLLVTAGLLGGVAQIFITAAYRYADASVVAPFEYVSMIFALAIGYMFFGEVPTVTMLCGASLVVAAGLLIIWRERQLGLERRRQRQAATPAG